MLAVALAGCGADGEPTRPDQPAPKTTTNAAVSISSSGYTSVGVGINRGPVSVGFGF